MPKTFQIVKDQFTPPAPLPSTTQADGRQTFTLAEEDFPETQKPLTADDPGYFDTEQTGKQSFEQVVTEFDRDGKEVSLPVYDDAGKRLYRPKYEKDSGRMTHDERGVMTYDEWLKQKNEGDVDWWEVATGAVKHLAGGFTKIPGKIKEEGVLEASANIPESFLAAMEGVRMLGGGAGRLLAKPFRTDEEENQAEYNAYSEFGDQIFRQLELRKSRMGDVARMFGAKELAEVYDDGIDPEVADSLSLIFDPTYLVGGGLAKVGAAGMRNVPKVTNKYAKQVMAAASKAANSKIGAAGGKVLKEVAQRAGTPITSFVSGSGKAGEMLGRGIQQASEIASEWAIKNPGKAGTAQAVVGAGTGYSVAPEGQEIQYVLGGAFGGKYALDAKRFIGAGETLEKAAQRIGGAAEAAQINSVRVSGLGTVAKTRKMSEDVAKQFIKYDNRVANKLLSGAAKIADTAAVGAGMGAGIGSLMPTDPNNPGWAAGLGIGTFAAPAGMASAWGLGKLARVEISRGGVPSADLRLRIKETPDHQLASEAVVERFAAGLPEEQRVRFVDPDRGLSVDDMATQAEAVNWAMGVKRYAGKDVDLFVGNAQEVVAETGNPFHETVAGFWDDKTNKIYINTDAEVSTMTLLHEVFHPTETWSSKQKKLDTEIDEVVDVDPLQDLQTDLVQMIVGTYAPDGSQMKAGLYSADELGKLIDQYNGKLYPDQTSNIIAKKAEIAAEFKKSGGADTPDLTLMNRELDELTIKQDNRATQLAAFDLLPESEKRKFIAREILSEQFAMFGESARHGIIRKARNTVLKKDYFRDKFLGMEIDRLKFNTLGRVRKTLEQVGVKFDLAGNPRGDMTATSVIFKDPKTGRQMVADPGIEHLIAQYIIEKDQLVNRVSETSEVGGSEMTFKAGDAVKKNADGTPKVPRVIIEKWAEAGWVKVYKSKKPTDKKTTTKKPTDEKPDDKKATDEKPDDKKATDEKSDDSKLKDGDILNSTGGKWQPGQRPGFTTPKERTRMDKDRVAALVAALQPVTKQVGDNEESVGAVRWRETADGGKNFSGSYFDDAQMKAIIDAPDDVVQPSFKKNIKMLNEAIKSREGQPFLADYWKAITGRGYDSKARMKVQLFTPIGMEISSAGNFNTTIFNVGYFENKINRWLGQSSKEKFWSDWADADGRVDVDSFRRDVNELLGTHFADDPQVKYPDNIKKEKMYSFLGVKPFLPGRKDWNTSVKDRKMIQKFRAERMKNLTPGMGDNFPINYGKARERYMPGGALTPGEAGVQSPADGQRTPQTDLRSSRFRVDSPTGGAGFRAAIADAAQRHKFGAAVEVKQPEFYLDPETKLFLEPDESAGLAITPDRDLVSVFKKPESQANVREILAEAAPYASTLDAFDVGGFLPNLYAENGFRPAARVPWNAEYAPPNWPKEMGEPDVVLMVRDPENVLGLPETDYNQARDQVPLFNDYDAAMAVQHAARAKVDEVGVSDAKYMPAGEQTNIDSRVSTRLPTAVKATEDPLKSNLLINAASVFNLPPDKQKTMAQIVGRYPNIKTTKKSLDAVAEELKAQSVSNLLWLHDKVPQDIRNRSKLWYEGARKITDDYVKDFDVTNPAGAGVLAVLSPGKDWFMNISLAERIIDTVGNKVGDPIDSKMMGQAEFRLENNPALMNEVKKMVGKKYEDLTSLQKSIYVRMYDEAYNSPNYEVISPEGRKVGLALKLDGDPAKVAHQSFPFIQKAISVIDNPSKENISSQLGGAHKIRNFYNNILLPTLAKEDVTIDTHAVAAALLRPFAQKSTEVTHNFGAGVPNSSVTGAKGTYGIYADAYRDAAKQRNVLPREMQSITWEAVRGLFPNKMKTAKNKKLADEVWTDYKRGRKSIEEVRSEIEKLFGGIDAPDWYR